MATLTSVAQWQPDSEAQECPICHKEFRIWFRRHHCRLCGRVVCGNCIPTCERYLSTSHVVSPPSQPFQESPLQKHKTCSECATELNIIKDALNADNTNNRNNPISDATRDLMVQNVRPRQDSNELNHCPVCGNLLSYMDVEGQEAHVDARLSTLTTSSSPSNNLPKRKRMLLSVLTDKNCHTLEDCNICYEEFEPGQCVGRLECFCVFHKKCILEWFTRKGAGSCPLHNQAT